MRRLALMYYKLCRARRTIAHSFSSVACISAGSLLAAKHSSSPTLFLPTEHDALAATRQKSAYISIQTERSELEETCSTLEKTCSAIEQTKHSNLPSFSPSRTSRERLPRTSAIVLTPSDKANSSATSRKPQDTRGLLLPLRRYCSSRYTIPRHACADGRLCLCVHPSKAA